MSFDDLRREREEQARKEREARAVRERESQRRAQEDIRRSRLREQYTRQCEVFLRNSNLELLIRKLVAAAGIDLGKNAVGEPRENREKWIDGSYSLEEKCYTAEFWWNYHYSGANYLDIHIDLDGTISINDVSIPKHVWQTSNRKLEEALVQAYRNPRVSHTQWPSRNPYEPPQLA
jgi:hypothetical protein